MDFNTSLLAPDERVLSTLEKDGSRRWLFPRLSRGLWWHRRRVVAYLLIALFTGLPYLKMNGQPIILLNIARRRFTLFGYTFLPTDTVLLALLAVAIVLTIFFFTALLGRVWCGWGCPQTVYMEFVFRPVERLFTGRKGVGGKPRQPVAAWRIACKYAAYFAICCYLAHTFLAYFVGVEQLRQWVRQSPAQHPVPFLVMMFVTGMMLFDFVFFREQTCIIACPYGRFQSVMLDRNSLTIAYDRKRGEPRGRRVHLPIATDEEPNPPKGDCVDCELCVAVCPTGIDIRNGSQIECVGCAQCIDACDDVMDKISRPRGLIRYSSAAALAGEKTRMIRPRVLVYPSIVAVLGGLLVYLIATKPTTDMTLLRGLGLPFRFTAAGMVENTFRVKLANRTQTSQLVRFSVIGADGATAVPTREVVEVSAGQTIVEPVEVIAPFGHFVAGQLDVTMRVTTNDGVQIDRPCHLLGPLTRPAQ